MELPADPSKLQMGAYHSTFFDRPEDNNPEIVPWQLRDDNEFQPAEVPTYFDIY